MQCNGMASLRLHLFTSMRGPILWHLISPTTGASMGRTTTLTSPTSWTTPECPAPISRCPLSACPHGSLYEPGLACMRYCMFLGAAAPHITAKLCMHSSRPFARASHHLGYSRRYCVCSGNGAETASMNAGPLHQGILGVSAGATALHRVCVF